MLDDDIREQLLTAWIDINSFFKDSRMTRELTYNEAVVMKLVYDQYRADGKGRTAVRSILKRTNMLKSQANRTIDSLCAQGYLVKVRDEEDARALYVCPVSQRLGDFLAVHQRSLDIVQAVIDTIGPEDTREFVRICEKFLKCRPLIKDDTARRT